MRPRAAASLWVSSCVGCTEAKGREALDGRYVVGAASLLRLVEVAKVHFVVDVPKPCAPHPAILHSAELSSPSIGTVNAPEPRAPRPVARHSAAGTYRCVFLIKYFRCKESLHSAEAAGGETAGVRAL